MKKLIAVLLVFCLANAASAVFTVDSWEDSDGWANPADRTNITDVNGWIHSGVGIGPVPIVDGIGYLGTRGLQTVATGETNRRHTITDDVSSGIVTTYGLINTSDWYEGLSTQAIAAGVGVCEAKDVFAVVDFSARWSNLIFKNAWEDPGQKEIQDEPADPDRAFFGKLGWFAVEIIYDLDNDTVSARWRDVNDITEGYIGDWVDLGFFDTDVDDDGDSDATFNAKGTMLQTYDAGDYPEDRYSGRIDRINNPITDVPLVGDFDGDGDVDAFDFADWQANYPTASGATREMGDADGDGDVDAFDFADWQANYPFPPPPEATPEPATLAVLAISGLALLYKRR